MGYLGYKEFLHTCSADIYAIPHLRWALSNVLNIMSVNQRNGPSCLQAAEAVAREEGKQKTDGLVQGVTAA